MMCQFSKKFIFSEHPQRRMFYSLGLIFASWARTDFGNGEAFYICTGVRTV
ncbi:hypothetical protein Pat9b_3535 [Pantoea sp. At-9b]|nr:hypothetical protein Pat9b_3535 [Pantoea sp. At-9b]